MPVRAYARSAAVRRLTCVSVGHISFGMAAERYAKNAGAVFSLKHHIVWCPKYRRPVLTPPVDGRLKILLAEIAA
ncbi:MAG: transposase, partial [Alphaproteobacteria bacterium]|nr:transposase [Alphaproteobacteria bacterium]